MRTWEEVRAELADLYDEDAWAQAAMEQYDLHPTVEQIGYWRRVGAVGNGVMV